MLSNQAKHGTRLVSNSMASRSRNSFWLDGFDADCPMPVIVLKVSALTCGEEVGADVAVVDGLEGE